MKYMKYVLILLSVLLIFASYCYCQGVYYEYFAVSGAEDYGLIVAPDQSDYSIENTYYVVRHPDTFDPIHLDTIKTRVFFAGDTNCIVYEAIDKCNTYLISLTLSPTIMKDTLIKISYDNRHNWINELDRYVVCSIKDSVIAYRYYTAPSRWNARIIKIMANDNIKIINTYSDPYHFSISKDFSQILICTGPKKTASDPPDGSLLIYDLPTDSISVISELGNSIRSAKRRDGNSPIYYLKRIKDTQNLWSYSRIDGCTIHTDYKYPLYVRGFYIKKDVIHYTQCDYRDRSIEVYKEMSLPLK